MPEPHEEIHGLNRTSPERVRTEELRGRWLKENPVRTPEDYARFKSTSEGATWEANYSERWDNSDQRWDQDKESIPVLGAADEKLKIRNSFEDTDARGVYSNLVVTFEDNNFSPFLSGKWDLPNDAGTRSEWQKLLNDTKQQVQRNATDLASVTATLREPATEAAYNEAHRKAMAEVAGQPLGNEPEVLAAIERAAQAAADEWKNSPLNKTLDAVETALKGWDALLATGSFPDKRQLVDAAGKCHEQFFEFYREHAGSYWNEDTPPFLRYQLVATMKALAEKVASQFASRAGIPSFSAMYERICDVPKSESLQGAGQKADAFDNNAKRDKSRAITCANGLESIRSDVKKDAALKDAATKLKSLGDLDVGKYLGRWEEALAQLGNPKNRAGVLNNLHFAAGDIAFRLGQAQNVVDSVFKEAGLSNPEKQAAIQALRQRYHALFEGVAVLHQRDILFCQKYF